MAMVSWWIICAIITAAGGFPSDPENPNYLARPDRELIVSKEAKWFRFPYPGEGKSLMCATVDGYLFIYLFIYLFSKENFTNHRLTPWRSVGNANYLLRRSTWNANWVTRLPY